MGRPAIVNRDQMFAMLREGMTQTAVAAQFRVTLAAINNRIAKARKDGTLPPDLEQSRRNTPAGQQGAPIGPGSLDYDHLDYPEPEWPDWIMAIARGNR